MTEHSTKAPTYFYMTDGGGPSAEHHATALAQASAHLDYLINTGGEAECTSVADPTDRLNGVADILVDTGTWWKVTLHPDINHAVQVNPRYQRLRMQWLEKGAPPSDSQALRDMVRVAVDTLVSHASMHYNEGNGV